MAGSTPHSLSPIHRSGVLQRKLTKIGREAFVILCHGRRQGWIHNAHFENAINSGCSMPAGMGIFRGRWKIFHSSSHCLIIILIQFS